MNVRCRTWVLAVSAVLILVGCGGGSGGGGGDTPAQPSNNWDSMIWDQGKWG